MQQISFFSAPKLCLSLLLGTILLGGCSSTPEGPAPRVINPMGLSGKLNPEAERNYSQARVLWRENFVRGAKQGAVCRDPKKAVLLLDKTILLEPAYAPAYVRRGLAQSDLGKYDAALDDLTKALSLEPAAETYAARALVALKANSPLQAHRDIQRAMRINEDSHVVWNAKAVLEFAEENNEAACESLNRACSLGDCGRRNAAQTEGLCP